MTTAGLVGVAAMAAWGSPEVPGDGSAAPTGSGASVPPATWTVTAEPFRAALVLDGVLEPRPPVTVAAGDDATLDVPEGSAVDAGDPVGHSGPGPDELRAAARAVEDAELGLAAVADPAAAAAAHAVRAAELQVERAREDLALLEDRRRTLTAPTAGTVRGGAEGGIEVHPEGLAAVAGVTPMQALRLADGHGAVTVSLRLLHGEAEARCGEPLIAAATAAPPGPTGGGGTGTQLRCLLPEDVAAVAGLPARIVVTLAELDEALLVPAAAVRFRGLGSSAGEVARVGADGTAAVVPVTVGPSDGVRTVVSSGLREGDTVLRSFPDGPPGPG